MGQPAVHIGLLSLELFLPSSGSLKSKRRIIKSFKDRVGHKFNVSIAEIDYHDKWQRAGIALCMISNDKNRIDETFQKILSLTAVLPEAQLTEHTIEFI